MPGILTHVPKTHPGLPVLLDGLSFYLLCDSHHTLFGYLETSIACMALPVRPEYASSIETVFSMSRLTERVIGSAIKIHRRLGPGLLESAYESCLAYELDAQGLMVVRQKPVPLVYDRVKLDCGFRADLLVENRVVVELKCKEQIHPVDEMQLLSHLRLLELQVGLLINFHVVRLTDGIRRIVNNYREQDIQEQGL
jgi:GxxExxY protein